jgi:hypothetical protein
MNRIEDTPKAIIPDHARSFTSFSRCSRFSCRFAVSSFSIVTPETTRSFNFLLMVLLASPDPLHYTTIQKMARGRWLKKVAKRVKNRVEDVKELVQGEGSLAEKLTEAVSGVDLGPSVRAMQKRGQECNQVARETMELCETTKTKSDQMVAFGSEIQSTLQSFGSSSMDASALETIRDLTDGEKLAQAMELAKDMDVIALGCADKSVQMIDIMEDAMDDLPDALEKLIDQAADQQDDEDDEVLLSLDSLDKDIEDVKSCIDSIQHLNIATALQLGLQAFEQLSSKAQQSRAMFESIQGFSKTVQDITNDFQNMDIISLSSKLKDILRCIRLSEVMRAFAEGTKKIMQVIIDLFKATSDRISTLWAALAFAKDCMADCVEHVVQAKALVLDAHTKSRSLLEKSESVMGQLKSVGTINPKTFGAVRELTQGDEIPDAIALARTMDDLIVECTAKVSSMVDRVSEGFQNLPDIITEGFDMTEAGKDESDPQPVGVEDDIAELEASREAMEEADIYTACKSGMTGFSSVSKKTELCTDMLINVQGFASNCDGTIESFMGVWDLESAMDKIKEMCRLVSMGELMKQFANQIKELLLAIIALMNSARDKLSSLDIKDLGMDLVDNLDDKVDDFVSDQVSNIMGDQVGDMVGDKVGEAMNKVTGSFNQFFKR